MNNFKKLIILASLVGGMTSTATTNNVGVINRGVPTSEDYCLMVKGYGLEQENDKTCKELLEENGIDTLDNKYAQNSNISLENDKDKTIGRNNVTIGFVSTTIGEENNTIGNLNNTSGNINNTLGHQNNVTNSNGNSLVGNNNNITNAAAKVLGDSNTIYSSNGVIAGNLNEIDGFQGTLTGHNNNIKNSLNSSILGNNNRVYESNETVLIGDNNVYKTFRHNNYVIGWGNKIDSQLSQSYYDWIRDMNDTQYINSIDTVRKDADTEYQKYAPHNYYNQLKVFGNKNKNMFEGATAIGDSNTDYFRTNALGNDNDTLILSNTLGSNNTNIHSSNIVGDYNKNIKVSNVFGKNNSGIYSNVFGNNNISNVLSSRANNESLRYISPNTSVVGNNNTNVMNLSVLKKIPDQNLIERAKANANIYLNEVKKTYPDLENYSGLDEIYYVDSGEAKKIKMSEFMKIMSTYEENTLTGAVPYGLVKSADDNKYYLAYVNSDTSILAMEDNSIPKFTDIKIVKMPEKIEDEFYKLYYDGSNIIIGSNIQNGTKDNPTDVIDSITLGYNSTPHSHSLSIGNDEFSRKLVNMSKGDINETSTDGINGSQLYALMNAKDENGIEINVDAWRYKLGVNDALKAIEDGEITDTNTNVVSAKVIKKYIDDKLRNVPTNESLGNKLDKDFNNYDASNNKTVATKLSDGANLDTPKGILITDTLVKERLDTKADKANVYTKDETYNKREINTKFDEIDTNFKEKINKTSADIASSNAMANIPQVNANKKVSIGAGVGYNDKNYAIALGISGNAINNSIVYKISGAFNSQKRFSMGAGINYSFGDNVSQSTLDNNDILNKLNGLAKDNEMLKNEISKLKEHPIKVESNVIKAINTSTITVSGFSIGKASLDDLDSLNDNIDKLKNAKQIIVTGYTDTRGEMKYNLNLGLQRAIFVMNKLVSLGIERDKIMIKSSGYSTIVDSGNSMANRRVEIILK